MPKSNTASRPSKPAKPHKDFPLTPHPTGRWCKKVRGKVLFFGKWDDPQGALARWLDQKDDLLAGRTPRNKTAGLTLLELCNRFLTAKKHQVETRELTPRSFADYHATCERILTTFGKTRLVLDLRSDDFESLRGGWAKHWQASTIGNEVQRVRVLFKYAYDAGLIDAPIRYGPMFKRPSRKVLRRLRKDAGSKMFAAADLRKILDTADSQMRAMVLLGLNCGFGNADVGTLAQTSIDLPSGWIEHPRPKTGIERRCPLWKETADALREAIANRPTPRHDRDARLVFMTKYGASWYRNDAGSLLGGDGGDEAADKRRLQRLRCSPLSAEFSKLLRKLGLYRKGLSFYALRHVFQTIGDGAKDPIATRSIMGHADNSMSDAYREGVDDDRLRAVADHVRGWLFPQAAKGPAKRKPK